MEWLGWIVGTATVGMLLWWFLFQWDVPPPTGQPTHKQQMEALNRAVEQAKQNR